MSPVNAVATKRALPSLDSHIRTAKLNIVFVLRFSFKSGNIMKGARNMSSSVPAILLHVINSEFCDISDSREIHSDSIQKTA